MKRGRGPDGETVTGGRAATVRHVFGERVLSICMPTNKDHPKGWRWVALSDVAQMESGHTPSRNHPEYWGGDIPWISVKDARLAHGKRLSETEEYTNSLGIANSSARLLPAGTVCLSRGGTVGYVVILDRPMATSQGFANWICGPQLIPEFLQYLLLAEADALEKFSIGTTIKTIYYPDLKAFHVCLPPLADQKRIVALLDEAFAGIDEATVKLSNEIKEANSILQSKFNQVFVQPPIEFDAIRDERNEATFEAKGRKATSRNIAGSLSLSVGKPSSPAKPGWRWVELSTRAQLESGHTPSRSKPEYWNGAIPWISIRDAKKAHGKVITETEEYITEQGVENSSARILPAKTVCLSRTASVGYCTITGRPMATSQDFVNWVIKGELHPEFLKFIFLAEGDQLLRFASGSVHQTIYYPETKAFSICVPTLKEQIAIARHLE